MNEVSALIAEELKLREQAIVALQRLAELHAQIDSRAIAIDRMARGNPTYRQIPTAHSSFIIRLRRGGKAVQAALSAVSGLSLPEYTSPEAQIEAYSKDRERSAARRERIVARREQMRPETDNA